MTTIAVCRVRPALEDLTDKEVAVLECLVQHKTTKEIARELAVAPNTVEKRLLRVRNKWATPDRNSTARLYRELAGDRWEKIPPRFSAQDADAFLISESRQDLPTPSVFQLSDVLRVEDYTDLVTPSPMGLQALDERFGKAWRIVAIPMLALLGLVIMVFAVNLAELLSDLI